MVANLENKVINKTLAGAGLATVGFIVGSSIQCVLEGKSIGLECVTGKITDNLTSDLFSLWTNLSLPGQIIKQTGVLNYDYKIVTGTVPGLSCYSDQEEHLGGCYNKSDIPQGYQFASVGRYTKPCNAGERDDGISCWRDTKGRGVGYPWKFGDPLNDSGMYRHCFLTIFSS